MQELVLDNMLFKNIAGDVYVYEHDELIFEFELNGLDFESRCNDFVENLYW